MLSSADRDVDEAALCRAEAEQIFQAKAGFMRAFVERCDRHAMPASVGDARRNAIGRS